MSLSKSEYLRVEKELRKLNDVRYAVALTAQATADEGYAKTYVLSQGGTDLATKINIPKDFLVKDASLDVVTAADKAEGGKFEDNEGFAVGDQYIDFVVNTAADGDGSSESDTHIYLNVNALVDVYTAGNGVAISAANVVSLVIDANNANGLTVSASGLALACAVGSVTSYVAASGTYVSGTTYYTDNTGATEVDTSEFEEGVTDVSSYYVASVTAATAGAMSGTDKDRLDTLWDSYNETVTAAEINAIYVD